jgi:hypothetical protein
VSDALRRRAAEAWAFRARVEREAAQRFARLARAIRSLDAESPVPPLMERAAADEVEHAALCAGLCRDYGQPEDPDVPDNPIAPSELGEREAVLYEVVAACCITETESVATVTALLSAPSESRVREVLHQIAKDEILHSRMGWAHLAREAPRGVAFLARWIPVMLNGTIDARLFAAPEPGDDDEALLMHGVMPLERKRAIFTGTLEDVVFPGLETFGVDTAPARAWLAAQRGASASTT